MSRLHYFSYLNKKQENFFRKLCISTYITYTKIYVLLIVYNKLYIHTNTIVVNVLEKYNSCECV